MIVDKLKQLCSRGVAAGAAESRAAAGEGPGGSDDKLTGRPREARPAAPLESAILQEGATSSMGAAPFYRPSTQRFFPFPSSNSEKLTNTTPYGPRELTYRPDSLAPMGP